MVESRRPDPDEAPIVTPPEVLARVAAHGDEVAVELAGLGVVVHGDLGVLGQEVAGARVGADAPDGTEGPDGTGGPDGTHGTAGAPGGLPIDAAVACVLGAIRGAQRQAAEDAQAAQKAAAATGATNAGTPPGAPTTRELAAELTVRIRRGTRQRLTPGRRRGLRPDGPTRT
jgi:hypothetical protein